MITFLVALNDLMSDRKNSSTRIASDSVERLAIQAIGRSADLRPVDRQICVPASVGVEGGRNRDRNSQFHPCIVAGKGPRDERELDRVDSQKGVSRASDIGWLEA